jgi:two-component system nitrogen regulation sensor histidine kinase GlnL
MSVMTADKFVKSIGFHDADVVINALPHPILSVDDRDRITGANAAAETFFRMSSTLLRRLPIADIVPFGSPLLLQLDQVRQRGAPVNEYRVDLGSPRIGASRVVDIHIAPHGETAGHLVLMLQARDQEPAVGYTRRRAIAGNLGRRR